MSKPETAKLMEETARIAMDEFLKKNEFDLYNLKWFPILGILSEARQKILSGPHFPALEFLECFLRYGYKGDLSEPPLRTKINEFLDLMQITDISQHTGIIWLYEASCNKLHAIKKSLSEIEANSCIGDDRIGIYYKSNIPSRCVSDLVIKIIPDKELLTVGRSVFDIKRMFIASEYCDKISFGKVIIDNNQIIDCYIKTDLGSYDNDQYVLLEKKSGILYWRKLDVISAPW